MSKKDIRKKVKGLYSTGSWLRRYFEKRTTKRKHKLEKYEDIINHSETL